MPVTISKDFGIKIILVNILETFSSEVSEAVFKSHNIAIFQSSCSDPIHLYSSKFKFHGVFEELIKTSSLDSV